MVYVFFIYGLSFFTLGFSILLYPKSGCAFKLAKNIWMIGVFGIIHGINEWIDMFIYIEQNKTSFIEIVNFIILPVSYLFLLYFGLRTVAESSKRFSPSYIWPFIILLSSIFLILSFQSSNTFLAGNIWARYLLGLPGILLTSCALFLHLGYFEKIKLETAKKSLILLGASFFLYALFSGATVPEAHFFPASVLNYASFQEATGLPVQVFRAVCALVSAYAVIRLLKVFRYETETKLTKLSRAIEESGDGVVITDRGGIIEYVNPAFEKQTGFTEEEAVGKKPNIIKSWEHPAKFYKDIWETILAGKTFRGYLINKKKNGELFHEYKAISPIKDKDENIIFFVSTGKDVTERALLEEKLVKLASTDRLTGIANRLRFDEHLQYSAGRAKRDKVELSAILFDIDNFKKINDTYGHLMGDYVLKTISEIGTKNVRKSDMFARWGGEEFIVLQSDTPNEEAKILAERLRKSIEDYPFENVGKITASFGVTRFNQNDDIDSFIRRGDEALYQAKQHGKNRVVIK